MRKGYKVGARVATVKEDKRKERKELIAQQGPTFTRHSDALRVFPTYPTLNFAVRRFWVTIRSSSLWRRKGRQVFGVGARRDRREYRSKVVSQLGPYSREDYESQG
uniref:Uncharacterized protein n=1 Tax=Vespula pensylvanica TaxID=30213 RepID=A0A834P7X0_VESPE|nr:hypothetical protein H0235_004607 [Vespula pensylvanica]